MSVSATQEWQWTRDCEGCTTVRSKKKKRGHLPSISPWLALCKRLTPPFYKGWGIQMPTSLRSEGPKWGGEPQRGGTFAGWLPVNSSVRKSVRCLFACLVSS